MRVYEEQNPALSGVLRCEGRPKRGLVKRAPIGYTLSTSAALWGGFKNHYETSNYRNRRKAVLGR